MSSKFWGRACARLLAPGLIALAGPASANPPAPALPPGAALPGLSRPVEVPGRLPAFAGQADKDKNGDDKNGKKDDNGASERPEAAPAPARAGALGLDEARALARDNQPAIAAARASLAIAEARYQAVMNIRVPTALARDLPHRRSQSAIGVQVATAGIHLAEITTDYGVQYSYLTFLYARTQQAVLDDSLENLRRLRKTVRTIVEEGLRGDITTRDLNTLDSYIAMVQGRREESVKGQARALSALREAIGLPCDAPLALRHDRLLSVKAPTVLRGQVIALAVARRPEIAQASLGVDVTALEVCAQDKCALNPSQPTYAANSDIHSQPLPAGSYDFDYKPGAVGPEMPVQISGNRRDRVAQAARYLDRSRTVVDKAKGLIRLEAEQAYLRFAEARDKLPRYEEAYRQASIAFEDVKKKFTPENMNVRLDQFLQAALVATQMRVSTNEARYQMLLGLALIERVTAGGLPANLASAPQEKDPE